MVQKSHSQPPFGCKKNTVNNGDIYHINWFSCQISAINSNPTDHSRSWTQPFLRVAARRPQGKRSTNWQVSPCKSWLKMEEIRVNSPVEVGSLIPSFDRVFLHPRWLAGFLPSRVGFQGIRSHYIQQEYETRNWHGPWPPIQKAAWDPKWRTPSNPTETSYRNASILWQSSKGSVSPEFWTYLGLLQGMSDSIQDTQCSISTVGGIKVLHRFTFSMLSNDFLGNDPPGRMFIPRIEQWLVNKASGFYTVCRKTMKKGLYLQKDLTSCEYCIYYV